MRLVAALVLAVLVVLAVAWVFQERLIYLPAGAPGRPAEAGLPEAEVVAYDTADGLTLHGWFVPARLAPADADPPGAVLVLPGNAGNRALRVPLAEELSERGLSVLLVDYRGFGGNPGRPSQRGLLDDARAARSHLDRRADVDPEAIVYYGESLGAAVATTLAAERPPAALVLRSPFPSLAEVAQRHYPFLPVRLLLRDRYAVTEALAGYDGPVLVVAGEQDTIVPTEMSRRIADAADARLVIIPGADHNDRALLDGRRLLEAVTAFLRDVGLDVG